MRLSCAVVTARLYRLVLKRLLVSRGNMSMSVTDSSSTKIFHSLFSTSLGKSHLSLEKACGTQEEMYSTVYRSSRSVLQMDGECGCLNSDKAHKKEIPKLVFHTFITRRPDYFTPCSLASLSCLQLIQNSATRISNWNKETGYPLLFELITKSY